MTIDTLRRGPGRGSLLSALLASLFSLSAIAQETETAQDTGAPAVATETDDRIIVGPLSPHAFQNQTPDDPGVEVDATSVNLSAVLEELREDARTWYQQVMALSDPFFEGREPGLAGNKHAADYIEFYFRRYGLEPAFPEPQPVEVTDPAEAETHSNDSTDEVPPSENAHGGTDAPAPIEWTCYRQTFDPFDRAEQRTDNVGGVLRGRGDLADEWVVIGAHYDHTGYSRRGREGRPTAINPGADDNASGTAGMLILARRLAEMYRFRDENPNLRSILFMAFSAEEMGLVGSQFYVEHSTIPADKIQIMINLDMIGRLRTDSLMVGGVGTAEGLLDLIRSHLLETGLTIYADPGGRGPSDHSSFYGGGIPVLFFFTGTHDAYHRPGDQGWTVNPAGAIRVIDLVDAIARDMVTMPERLRFTPAAEGEERGGRRGPARGNRASLGILPTYGAEIETGVMIETVYEGTAAEKAGLQSGDIIIGWNGEEVTGGRSLMRQIVRHEPGDEVTLEIQRGDETISVKVTLQAR